MNTKYRIDTVENNERLHIDVRDMISLVQGLSSDVKLNLDIKTLTYVQSILSSMIATYEASSEDSTIIIKSSSLKKLKNKVFKNIDQKQKAEEKASKNENNNTSEAEPVEEEFDNSEEDPEENSNS